MHRVKNLSLSGPQRKEQPKPHKRAERTDGVVKRPAFVIEAPQIRLQHPGKAVESVLLCWPRCDDLEIRGDCIPPVVFAPAQGVHAELGKPFVKAPERRGALITERRRPHHTLYNRRAHGMCQTTHAVCVGFLRGEREYRIALLRQGGRKHRENRQVGVQLHASLSSHAEWGQFLLVLQLAERSLDGSPLDGQRFTHTARKHRCEPPSFVNRNAKLTAMCFAERIDPATARL